MSDDIIDLEARRRRRAATERALCQEAAEEAQEPRAAWLAPGAWRVKCPHCNYAILLPAGTVRAEERSGILHCEPVAGARFMNCPSCGLRDIRVGPISVYPERIVP